MMCAFFEEKRHSLSVAPEPLAIWNKELEDLVLKLLCFFVEGQKELGYGSVWVLFVVRS